MIGRFLFWLVVFVISEGMALHYNVDLPSFIASWLGKLPGDMWIRKDETLIYFPITSAVLPSLFLSIVFTMVFKKKD